MGALSPTHWLIVVGVLVLLFGAKKLPDMARSVGQSARVLKGELHGLRDDDPAPPAPPTALPQSTGSAPTGSAPTGSAPTEAAPGADVPRPR